MPAPPIKPPSKPGQKPLPPLLAWLADDEDVPDALAETVGGLLLSAGFELGTEPALGVDFAVAFDSVGPVDDNDLVAAALVSALFEFSAAAASDRVEACFTPVFARSALEDGSVFREAESDDWPVRLPRSRAITISLFEFD